MKTNVLFSMFFSMIFFGLSHSVLASEAKILKDSRILEVLECRKADAGNNLVHALGKIRVEFLANGVRQTRFVWIQSPRGVQIQNPVVSLSEADSLCKTLNDLMSTNATIDIVYVINHRNQPYLQALINGDDAFLLNSYPAFSSNDLRYWRPGR